MFFFPLIYSFSDLLRIGACIGFIISLDCTAVWLKFCLKCALQINFTLNTIFHHSAIQPLICLLCDCTNWTTQFSNESFSTNCQQNSTLKIRIQKPKSNTEEGQSHFVFAFKTGICWLSYAVCMRRKV